MLIVHRVVSGLFLCPIFLSVPLFFPSYAKALHCSDLSSSIVPDDLVKRALHFAKIAHAGVKRKFDGKPYISHPVKVSNILKAYTQDQEILAAAILHDVLEDNKTITKEILIQKFGFRVAALVEGLSSNKAESNRMGKAEYLKMKTMKMSLDELMIKLADRLHNTSDFEVADVSFIDKYREETNLIIGALMGRKDLTYVHRDLIRRINEAMWDGQVANIAKNFAADIFVAMEGRISREDYIAHLSRVSKILEKLGASVEVRMAAYLKDSVEKNPESLPEILSRFGPRVGSLVAELTVDPLLRARATSRQVYEAEHFSRMSQEAKLIKLAGRYEYLVLIFQRGLQEKHQVYISETEAIVKVARGSNFDKASPLNHLLNRLEALLNRGNS